MATSSGVMRAKVRFASPSAMTSNASTAGNQRHAEFAQTRWSVVLAARETNPAQSRDALETLCRTYWFPLYAFVRRQGHSPADAEDLTQAFFLRMLERDYLKAVDREKGRFRSFLLVALKHFLANEWDRAHAQKRGGDRTGVPLDTSAAETRYESEPHLALPPENVFDRRWALALLDQTMARLRHEFEALGKAPQFDALKVVLTSERNAIPYPKLAAATGLSEGALRVAIHRLRRRFREVFREEIAHTVSTPEEIDGEIRHLMSVLAQ